MPCNYGTCALQDFVYQIGNPSVTTVKTNGLYYKPGEKSYMRKTIAYQVLGSDHHDHHVNAPIVLRLIYRTKYSTKYSTNVML